MVKYACGSHGSPAASKSQLPRRFQNLPLRIPSSSRRHTRLQCFRGDAESFTSNTEKPAKPGHQVRPNPSGESKATPRSVEDASSSATTRVETTLAVTRAAQAEYAHFNQEKVDAVFKAAALAANMNRIPLAKLAVEETGIGLVEDKVIKNHFASEEIYNRYKNEKTVGVISEDPLTGIERIAEPMGVLCGIVPTTNPTSTAIFKCLLALKTRNGIVLAPHPRASGCTIAAAKIVRDAAVAAGAPENIISFVENPSKDETFELMRKSDMIIATGGPAMVRSSYSSGTPAIGVGAGNTPALIDDDADIEMAVNYILLSKTFDLGVICASEQAVVVLDGVAAAFLDEIQRRGAVVLGPADVERVRKGLFVDGRLNADTVGRTPFDLAKMFGLENEHIDENTRLLLTPVDAVGPDEVLSGEKLCPILALYVSKTFDNALETANSLVENGGAGHTSVIYSNNIEHIRKWEDRIKTVRMLVNMPSSQGAIGDLYNNLDPSLTLGCGSFGHNSVSNNVQAKHLLNVKTVAKRRENMLWFRVPPRIYFKEGSLNVALRDLVGCKRAFIVTDRPILDMGYVEEVQDILDDIGCQSQVFYHVHPDPDIDSIRAGAKELEEYGADVIIALGGGSPMDAAKIMWLLYADPQFSFEGVATRFMDIRKRIYEVPPDLSSKALLVCIPTTSGTGSEVTPFSVVTDSRTHVKYPLADYSLTPSMAIIDPNLIYGMPKTLTANGGIDAVTHALESLVSAYATDYTRGLSLQALQLLFEYLPRAYEHGAADREAREKVHNAATIAGMAFANAFLGICHSMAHKLGARFNIAHGLANALMISHVILYNAEEAPYKVVGFAQYKKAHAGEDYANLALTLGFAKKDMSQRERVACLVRHVEDLKASIGIPASIKEALEGKVTYDEFIKSLDELAENAFDDQCTGTSPRSPLIADLARLLRDAWDGIDEAKITAWVAEEPTP